MVHCQNGSVAVLYIATSECVLHIFLSKHIRVLTSLLLKKGGALVQAFKMLPLIPQFHELCG